MADFSKSFRFLLDSDVKGAVDGLGQFSDAAKKAESDTTKAGQGITGSIGNMVAKTGVGQKAMSTFGLSAGQMGIATVTAAGAAGGAIAKFALDGAKNFSELGERVETFKGISGTTADAASRWIAVADDYGVSAEELSGSVGKLGKALGANIHAFDEYGVAVARTKDGNVDLSATAINVIDSYNNMKDPTLKAKLATEAFGKSYTALLPLIDEGSSEILARFKEVDGAQLFTDKKLQQAEDFRLAMDDLHDTMTDFQMTVGQQVIPVVKSFAQTVDATVGPLNRLTAALPSGALGETTSLLLKSLNPLTLAKAGWDDLSNKWDKAYNSASLNIGSFPKISAGLVDQAVQTGLAAVASQRLGDNLSFIARTKEQDEAASAKASAGTKAYMDDIGRLTDRLHEERDALRDVQDAQSRSTDLALSSQEADLQAADAIATYNKSLKDGKLTAREHQQAFIDVQQEINRTADTYADYVVNQAKGAGQIKTAADEARVRNEAQIESLEKEAATLKPGSALWNAIESHIDHLKSIPTSIHTNVDTTISGNAAGKVKGAKALGGPVMGGSTYLVGERGPELFTPTSSGTITPNSGIGYGGSIQFTINVVQQIAPGADPGDALAKLVASDKYTGVLARYIRQNVG